MSDYTKTGKPLQGARGISKDVRDEFALVEVAVASKMDKAGGTFTGAVTFDDAATFNQIPTSPTPAPGDSSVKVATTEFVAETILAATLPAQLGNAGKFIKTDGVSAFWEYPTAPRSARTSNTQLTADDIASWIDITGGTFTQTFAACASLGNRWWCYIGNSGTGDITLDPDGAETIDGLSEFIMYPGEVRLVFCDGSALRSIVLNAFYRTFTASGTFTKPPGYTAFQALLWGGGGGGCSGIQTYGGGGGGGACVDIQIPASDLSASEAVTIGAGGQPNLNSEFASGGGGGTSSFAGFSAYGGAGGIYESSYGGRGGGGGGVLSAGSTYNGGAPDGGVVSDYDSSAGGGAGGYKDGTNEYNAGNSYRGGGGGLRNATTANTGSSIYGGGGGFGCSAPVIGYGPHYFNNNYYLDAGFTQNRGLSFVGGRGACISNLVPGDSSSSTADFTSAGISFNVGGRAAGDLLVCVLVSNHASDNTPTAPVGWTQQSTISGGVGSGTASNSGVRRVTVFTKISDGTEAGEIFTLTGGVCLAAQSYVLRKDASASSIEMAFATGTDTTIGTSFSVTTGNIDIQDGDIVIARSAINSSAGSYTNLALTGLAWSIFCRLADSAVFGGTKAIGCCALASNQSSGGVTFSATASVATADAATGAAIVMRFRGCSEILDEKIAQAPGGGGSGCIPGARGELRIRGVI